MTETPQAKLRDVGLLIGRVGLGAMMLFGHGLDKLAHFAEKAESFPDPLGVGSAASLALAVFAEVGCSILVVVGLGTRIAAFFLLFTMGVAVAFVHSGDAFGVKEKALLYAAGFTIFVFAGGGRFAADARLPPKVRRRIA